MDDLTNMFRNIVDQSVSGTEEILEARAEEYDLERHAIFEMREQIETLNRKLEESERESKQIQKIERKRFISNFIFCVISAIAAVVGAVFAGLSFFF